MADRKEGTVRRLFPDRAYGFLYCPADERDYFFHKAQLQSTSFAALKDGDILTFVVGEGPKGGIEAQEVRFERREDPLGHETREQLGLQRKPESRLRKR